MQVDFYHLTRSPVEAVLPKLLEKILSGEGRALVVAGDEPLLARLDEHLWRYEPASFLPHGRSGSEGEAGQPVLLSPVVNAVNGARFLLIADGRWPEGELAFDRVFFLFDQTTIADARDRWRSVEGEKKYWKQDERGRWLQGP